MELECCICRKPIEPDQKGRYQALIGINLSDVYRAAQRKDVIAVWQVAHSSCKPPDWNHMYGITELLKNERNLLKACLKLHRKHPVIAACTDWWEWMGRFLSHMKEATKDE